MCARTHQLVCCCVLSVFQATLVVRLYVFDLYACVCVFVGTVGYGVCDCCMSVCLCWACIVVMLVCAPKCANVEPQLHVVLCVCQCVCVCLVLFVLSTVCACDCVYECMCVDRLARMWGYV